MNKQARGCGLAKAFDDPLVEHGKRDAATTDEQARKVWIEISERRAQNMRALVSELGPDGTLRADITINEAADVIWATASAELYILFTQERGWAPEAYEQWLADSWSRLLLHTRSKTNRHKASRDRS